MDKWMKSFILSVSIIVSVQATFSLAQILDEKKFALPARFDGNVSMVIEFNERMSKYDSVKLGLGAPDYSPPNFLATALATAALSSDASLSQYSPMSGHPRLLKAIARLYSRLLNHTLDEDENIVITVGATEALYLIIQTTTSPGDEWIIIEPYYEPYAPMIKMSLGIPRYIALQPTKTSGHVSSADWTFDRDEMKSLFNEKTKGILVNTPHNPTGKMFDHEELTFIADLAKMWDVLVVFDEVYEFKTFDNNEHIRMATLPGMFDRTISIGSAGKIFGATGYRIGWAYGNKELILNMKILHDVIIRSATTDHQEAIAIGFEREIKHFGTPLSFIETARKATEAKRNQLARILADSGMVPIVPQGGIALIANWTTMPNVKFSDGENEEFQSFNFAKWLNKNVKVLGFPLAGFYSEGSKHLGDDGIRFTIFKGEETYEKVEKNFQEWQLKQN